MCIRDSNDLAFGRNPLARENPIAMDLGAPDQELEAGTVWIELGRLNEIGSHVGSLILANRLGILANRMQPAVLLPWGRLRLMVSC